MQIAGKDLHLYERERVGRRTLGMLESSCFLCYPNPIDESVHLDELTPREIVRELDKYVIGQAAAKRAVAIALRNRIRRQKLPPEMAEEVMPKNIIMIGPTGVGKTEIARRLAKLANSPFLKVEASKFTEVGYVGRDVESMIRDLVEIAIDMVRNEKLDEVAEKAEANAEERILDLLLPPQHVARSDRRSRARRERPCGTHPREAARAAARRQAGRAHGRDRSEGAQLSGFRDHLAIRASRRWISTSRISFPAFSASARRSAR